MFNFEIYPLDEGHGFRIIKDGFPVLIQEFDPSLEGFALMTEERALELAQATLDEYINRPEPPPEEIPKTPDQLRIEALEAENAQLKTDMADVQLALAELFTA